MFISNNRASFHLWRKENLVKQQKVSKYYANDCGWAFSGISKAGGERKATLCNICCVRTRDMKHGEKVRWYVKV